jgi:hypothetical protein
MKIKGVKKQMVFELPFKRGLTEEKKRHLETQIFLCDMHIP